MSIHPIIIGIILFCLVLSFMLVRKNSTLMIKILRIFTIITSLACILIYLIVDSKPILDKNIFLDTLYFYVFFTWFLLYPLMLILSVHDIIKLIKEKNIKYIYYLVFLSILIPYLGIESYHLYYEKVF